MPTASQPLLTIERARLPDGAGDIARLLGLSPAETVWDYNLISSPESGFPLPDSSVAVAHNGITSLVRGGTSGLSLGLYPGFLDYQQEYIDVGNVLQVNQHSLNRDWFDYPTHSIPVNVINILESDRTFCTPLMGKTLVTLFPTDDYKKASGFLGGRTLISPEQAVQFNSKCRVFNDAAESGYNVAPFVTIPRFEDLSSALKSIQKKAEGLGLDPSRTKYWLKFDSLAGGLGVTSFRPAENSLSDLQTWVHGVMDSSGLSRKGLFMPLLIDIDVGCLPEVRKILTNANVQAVVGPQGPVVTGTTFQKVSENGDYQGGCLPLTDEEKDFAQSCQPFALPTLRTAWAQGYRGYAGIDILLCETQDAGRTGYILEMNGRLNSSTSMLSLSHWHDRKLGVGSGTATNISVAHKPLDAFPDFARHFASVMYRGEASGETGIVPIIMKPDSEGRIKGAKTIALAPDAKSLHDLERRTLALAADLSP